MLHGSGITAKATRKFVPLLLSLFATVAIALLQNASRLGGIAFDHQHVVVGQLAKLLLHITFNLVPLAFQNIAVHGFTLLGFE